MYKYDFDKIINRHGTNAVKTALLKLFYGSEDLIPLWVADMDFETPDFIVDALKKRMEHPVFGYSIEPIDYKPSIIDWIESMHQWKIEQEWLCYIPGIVKGIGFAVNVFTEPADKVIIQPPIYHPFRLVPEGNGRKVIYNPLKWEDNQYKMDFEQLKGIIDEKCKLLILSNPHNPAGIVWDKETLRTLANICNENNILVISDEIHADMALYGNKHIPFATVSKEAEENSITFGAPSKTFNIAGIVSSYAIISNDQIREKFFGWLNANELTHPNLFATIATQAAYQNGKQWLKQMLNYLEQNINFVERFLQKNIPQIKIMKPQASFLIWLDCRELNLSHRKLNDFFVKDAGLALNDGEMFGIGGEGFMRMNIGTSKKVLEKAMKQLQKAVEEIS